MEISTQEIYHIVFKEYPDVLDVKQVSKLLGVSTKTVYKLLRDGSLASLLPDERYPSSRIDC